MTAADYIPCPVCVGLVAAPHANAHPPHVLDAAVRRDAAIAAAVEAFKKARKASMQAHPACGSEYRHRMIVHERALDEARDAAHDAYRKETEL